MSYSDDERGSSRRLWVMAAVAALALHVGGAALAVGYLKIDDDDGLGANGAAFAVELASPDLPQADLLPGPDAEATQASMPQVEQKAELEQTDLPTEKPTSSEDADRVVSENASKKPQEEETKIAAIQTEASPERDDELATARQQLDDKSRESEQMKAPNPGVGADRLKLTADWGRRIRAYFNLHKRYPEHRKSAAGNVKVSFVLNRRGNVISANVLQSSGDAAFDAAAISMIHRSDPVPLPPAGLTDDTFSFNLDVNFTKRK
jgi:periplasmic protein TonB